MADDIKLVIGVDDRDLIKAQKEQLKFQRNIITIEKAFRNGDITAKRYNQELNKQTKELQKLGGSYRTASSEVRKYAYAMRQADDATLAQSQAMAFAGKKINRMGVGLQQAGYQIGDFAVQIQGGTNAMVALGQQGSQLLGIFGPYGALAGAALAIGTAFIAPFMRATKEVKAFQKAADEALKSVKDRVDELQTGRDKNVRAYDEEIARLRTLALGQLEVYNAKLDTAKAQRLSNSDAEVFSRQERENYHATLDLIRKQMKDKGEYLGYLDQERQLLKKKAQEERDALEQKRKQEELARQERLLGQQMADLERQRALAQFKKDVAAEAETLDAMFQNRTLYYSIRFSGDADVMSQSLTPSTKGMKPTQSYQELITMGWSPEDLERIGVKAPRKSGGGSKTSETNEKYLDNLLRETKLKAQLVGVSEQEAAKLKLLNTLEAKGIDLNDDRVKTLIEEQKNLAELEKAYEAQQEMVGMFKDTLTDALMSVIDGSRSVADAFKNMMRQILSSLAQKSIIQPLVSGLTGGLAGGAAGGLMGGLAAGTGIAATMGTIGSSLGAGFMTSVYGGLAGTAGAVSGGLAVGGAAGVATAIGAVAAPLLAVAAVFSFFKKKVKELDSGISATVTNMDSYVESFSTIQTKRFFGLSKKVSTNTTAMDADNPISLAIASVQQSIFSTAQYLGIATDSLSAFSYEFKLSLKGLSEEAKMQKIAEEVNKLGDAFANLLPNVLNMEHLTAIMDERYSLETRLLEAQGNTEALRERELANTNEYNRAILEQIFAAEDAKAALDNLNNSLKETDFATLLDFNRAKAYARLGMNVANSPEVPSMSNTAASGVQAITNPMNTASGEIVQLRSEMKEMHKEAMFAYSKLIKNGKDSRDTLRSWDVVGLPAERTA